MGEGGTGPLSSTGSVDPVAQDALRPLPRPSYPLPLEVTVPPITMLLPSSIDVSRASERGRQVIPHA